MCRGKLSKGLYVNLADAFAVSQRLLLCHLPAATYHRIYINAVVAYRGDFAAVFVFSASAEATRYGKFN